MLKHIANQVRNLCSYINVSRKMMDPVVKISQGKLKGAINKLLDGSPYYSFKGIPYAEPPVGELRFKDPLPPKPWTGVYEAIEHGPISPQYDLITTALLDGDENCLFLNVYTRSLAENDRKPVMVFIHGGGFMSGSGNSEMNGPEYLLQHDIVLVTFNYRLEVLGYLCLDNEEVPGNAGMKDQVAALRWVNKNITKFGGDPNNVTIFGESAGSASVTYHMISPMSKGLFHKAIAQSGVCLGDWAQGKDGKERAFRVAKYLGKDTNDPAELLEFLRGVPAKSLAKLTFKTLTSDEKYRGLPLHFVPVVEKFKDGAFISENPIDLLMQNKIHDVPLIIGYTSAEGLSAMSTVLRNIDFFNKHFEYNIPREMLPNLSEDSYKDIARRIKEYYFKDSPATPEDVDKIISLKSDVLFIYQIHRFLHFFTSNARSKAFMYKFDLQSDLNIVKRALGCENVEGACHADDLFYLFRSVITKDAYDEQPSLRELVHIVTKLWTDFAKTGNPTPDNALKIDWKPFTSKRKEYLNLSEKISLEYYADKDNVEFWNKLYCESGQPYITKSNL